MTCKVGYACCEIGSMNYELEDFSCEIGAMLGEGSSFPGELRAVVCGVVDISRETDSVCCEGSSPDVS